MICVGVSTRRPSASSGTYSRRVAHSIGSRSPYGSSLRKWLVLERAVVRAVDVELVGVTRLVADASGVVEARHRDDVVATDDDDVGERRVRRDAREGAVADADDEAGDLVDDLVGSVGDARVGVPRGVRRGDRRVALDGDDDAR